MRWLAFIALTAPAFAECPPNPDIDDAEAAVDELTTQLEEDPLFDEDEII